MYISKNWVYYQIFGISVNALCVVVGFFLPESPKFLYESKQYDKCREVLRYISKFNGVNKPVASKFDREVAETVEILPSEITESTDAIELKGTFKELINVRAYVINLVLLCLVWVTTSFDWYLVHF